MTRVPLFVSLYNRPEMARTLVESAQDREHVGRINVLDTGPESEGKQRLQSDYDVEYHDVADDGFAHNAHNAAVDITDDEFYLFADSDEEIIGDVGHMIECIEKQDDVGAVASPLIEPDRVFYMAGDFREADGGIYREATHVPDIRVVNDVPYAEFDFVSTCAVYRRSCVEDYRWDSRYEMGLAQDDFHLGHWKHTDWTFLLTFMPVFKHHTGGTDSLQEKRESRNTRSQEQFLEKWGYDFWETRSPWMSSNYEPRDDFQRAVRHYKEGGFTRLLSQALDKIL